MIRKTAFVWLVAGSVSSLGMLAATSAYAATATTTFNVTANIAASCTIAATDLNFGAYDPFAAGPLNATSTVTVTCTNLTPYDVGLDGGGGTVAARRMLNGASPLNYQLYSEGTFTTIWGDTIGTDT
ncbi:MAG: Csu type fimbrial protein, partial [Methyloligellaceae bacterium]